MSSNWTLEKVLSAFKESNIMRGSGPVAFSTVSTDTRSLEPGALFLALRGERFDGHDFVYQAAAAGAKGLVVENAAVGGLALDELPEDVVVVSVPDTMEALGHLALALRRSWGRRLAAITGSNGKSSTKEMCWSVLQASGLTALKNEGNFNNLVGLPQTLLALEPDHDVAVVELGTNAPGEIDRLSKVAEPDVSALLNVGPAHLEGLKSLEGVALEKGAIYENLKQDGVAVVNLDDPMAAGQAARASSVRRMTFGMHESADVRVSGRISVTAEGTGFDLAVKGEVLHVRLKLAGEHQAVNAAAAVAVALGLGADIDAIVPGLEATEPIQGRLAVREMAGVRLVDDTYNANPASVHAAIKTAALLKGRGRLFLVVGPMLELGPESLELHRKIGADAVGLGVDFLAALDGAEGVVEGALEAGIGEESCTSADEAAELASWVAERLGPGDIVLFKGSRAARTENVLHALEEVLA